MALTGEPIMSGPICVFCKEEMGTEVSAMRTVLSHRECSMRSVLGSISHLRKTCSCFGGTESDPPDMSYRDAARLTVIEAIKLKLGAEVILTQSTRSRMRLRPSTYETMTAEQRHEIDTVLGLD